MKLRPLPIESIGKAGAVNIGDSGAPYQDSDGKPGYSWCIRFHQWVSRNIPTPSPVNSVHLCSTRSHIPSPGSRKSPTVLRRASHEIFLIPLAFCFTLVQGSRCALSSGFRERMVPPVCHERYDSCPRVSILRLGMNAPRRGKMVLPPRRARCRTQRPSSLAWSERRRCTGEMHMVILF